MFVASMMQHFHVRNQRNQCNQRDYCNQRNQYIMGKTAQRHRSLELLQTLIDYVDYG